MSVTCLRDYPSHMGIAGLTQLIKDHRASYISAFVALCLARKFARIKSLVARSGDRICVEDVLAWFRRHTSKRILLATACVSAIGFALNPSFAQSDIGPLPLGAANTDEDWWTKNITALVIAPDGTWGVATEPSIGRAIANAISHCKSRYRQEIGCGYQFTSIRAGWSLGIRCGNENIIVAARTLVAAEQAAVNREVELRRSYVPNMPPCVRMLLVDPHGYTVAPNVADLLQMVARRQDKESR